MISSEAEGIMEIAFNIRDLNEQMKRVADVLELMYDAEYILKTDVGSGLVRVEVEKK